MEDGRVDPTKMKKHEIRMNGSGQRVATYYNAIEDIAKKMLRLDDVKTDLTQVEMSPCLPGVPLPLCLNVFRGPRRIAV